MSIKMAKIQKKLTMPNVDKDTEQQHSFITRMNAKGDSYFGRQFVSILPKRLNMVFLCKLTIVLVGIYPIHLKIYANTNTCIRIFIETLFIMTKNCKQT
jgi:hypothetical protein